LALPHLGSLRLDFSEIAIDALLEAPLPNLERLAVWTANEPCLYDLVSALFGHPLFTQLTHLSIGGVSDRIALFLGQRRRRYQHLQLDAY
jgi:hypothetical protein